VLCKQRHTSCCRQYVPCDIPPALSAQQEAGLLLWYHSQRGEDGAAEVLAAGVVTTCLDVLGNSAALPADKSTAAGMTTHAMWTPDPAKSGL
jgi:hypothetical protein